MNNMISKVLKLISVNLGGLPKKLANASMYFSASLVQVVVGLILSPILSLHLGHRDFAIV